MVKRITFLLVALTLASIAPESLGQYDPNFADGRTTIVHLFEWKYHDIADECERFLGPRGFGGVQTSPVNENAVINSPFRPWWERYQPVSYILDNRSGNEEEFKSMVERCNKANVRVYVDVVLNHMTGPIGAGTGTAGSFFNSTELQYDGVPYSYLDFTPGDRCTWVCDPKCEIDYMDPNQVRNCELSGLKDLFHNVDYVRQQQIIFLNRLISFGVAGFRVDAAKHMWPGDLQLIFRELNDLPPGYGFHDGAKPFLYQEVIDLGFEAVKGAEYFDMGRVTEFKYSSAIGEVFKGVNRDGVIHKKPLADLEWIVEEWQMYPSDRALAFVDNHDNQRGHGAGGDSIVTYHDSRIYKMAVAFTLAWPYSVARVMSSFAFDRTFGTDDGPPNDNGIIKNVTLNEFGTCNDGWVCEHRWRQIFNMVEFRNVAHGTGRNDFWTNGNRQIAFCRGDKGFIAINADDNFELGRYFQTCLPGGIYCDVISGLKENGRCTGNSVNVAADGWAYIHIDSKDPDPVIAIHSNSRL